MNRIVLTVVLASSSSLVIGNLHMNGERYMSFRQDLPGFGEPGEGAWDGFARINTETKSGGLVGVFRHGAAEPSRRVTVRGLDPGARYAVMKGARREPVAELTGRELEERGFQVEFANRIDGELFEISRIGDG